MARHRARRGLVLATSLVLLVVIALLALSMFSSFGLQEQLSETQREQHRALEAAVGAEQHAERWLLRGEDAGAPVACGARAAADAGRERVCSNELASLVASVTSAPWVASGPAGGDVGTEYAPATGGDHTAAETAPPRFYIAALGPSTTGTGTIYRIDAVGRGASPDSVAVIESTYLVAPGVRDLGVP